MGGRADIQRLVRALAETGAGVLLISSEMDEIVEASSRVIVLRDGRVVAELTGDAVSHDAIVHAMADDA